MTEWGGLGKVLGLVGKCTDEVPWRLIENLRVVPLMWQDAAGGWWADWWVWRHEKGRNLRCLFFRNSRKGFICFASLRGWGWLVPGPEGFWPTGRRRDPRAVYFSFTCFTVFLSQPFLHPETWGGRCWWQWDVYLEMCFLLAAVTMWESFALGDLCGWPSFSKIAEEKRPVSGNNKVLPRGDWGKYDNSATGSLLEEWLSVQINKCLFRRKGREPGSS